MSVPPFPASLASGARRLLFATCGDVDWPPLSAQCSPVATTHSISALISSLLSSSDERSRGTDVRTAAHPDGVRLCLPGKAQTAHKRCNIVPTMRHTQAQSGRTDTATVHDHHCSPGLRQRVRPFDCATCVARRLRHRLVVTHCVPLCFSLLRCCVCRSSVLPIITTTMTTTPSTTTGWSTPRRAWVPASFLTSALASEPVCSHCRVRSDIRDGSDC